MLRGIEAADYYAPLRFRVVERGDDLYIYIYIYI
jgi:hypothetical protein